MTEYRLNQLKRKLEKLSQQRENNINRFIIPIEIKMNDLRDRIREGNGVLIVEAKRLKMAKKLLNGNIVRQLFRM